MNVAIDCTIYDVAQHAQELVRKQTSCSEGLKLSVNCPRCELLHAALSNVDRVGCIV